MKRLSKISFKQIMIHIKIKHELDSLKEFVRAETGVKHRLSYGDVIIALIKVYKNNIRTKYPLNQKLLVGNKLEKNNLSVSIPIKPKPFSASLELDGKIRVSNSIKS